MTPADVRVFCKLDATGQSLMRSAMQQLQLSARAFHRVLKIARTIADLAGNDEIAPAHLAEAIHLRQAEKARIKRATGNREASPDLSEHSWMASSKIRARNFAGPRSLLP
jgi:predicted ATP-dependent protease